MTEYTSATVRAIRIAWQKFDAFTAYGCASKGRKYDADKCQAAWQQYLSVLQLYGVPTEGMTPIGLK